MAESLAIALRAAFDPPEQLCSREPDFIELYAVLGDEAKQNEIRSANKIKHCGLLIKNPSGCHGCPFNPFESKDPEDGRKQQAEAVLVLHENPEAVELALWLEEQERMEMLAMVELSATEVETIRIVREERERQHRRELGKLVGYEVAVIIGKMFSKQNG